MARTRIAVIGLGMAVAPHAKSLVDLADRVEVAAAYSPTAARREAFAKNFDFPLSGDLDSIMADRSIKAVMILTPPNSHSELVAKAAASGKHILLEKPLEISIERAEALVAAAEGAGVKLGVVLQHRFRPAAEALEKIMAEGRLGDIVSASARILNWRPQDYYDQPGRGTKARDGGGVLITQAIHTLDLLISLTGLPERVTAHAATSPIHRMETEDIAAALLAFPGGGTGTILATTSAYPGLPESIEIIGTKGTAVLQGTALIARFHDGTSVTDGDAAAGGGAGADPMAFSHQAHRAVISDFIEAVETGREPRVSGREALKVHDLIGAMLASAASGTEQVVRWR
jgi:predicted dehydrogenase